MPDKNRCHAESTFAEAHMLVKICSTWVVAGKSLEFLPLASAHPMMFPPSAARWLVVIRNLRCEESRKTGQVSLSIAEEISYGPQQNPTSTPRKGAVRNRLQLAMQKGAIRLIDF